MAMAANNVVAETLSLEAVGNIAPDDVLTPAAFVSAVVEIDDEAAQHAMRRRNSA